MTTILDRYKQLNEEFEPKDVIVKKALRVNTLKITEQDLVARLQKKNVKLEKIPYLASGYYYEADFSLGASEEYLLGYIYLQEAASQIPAQVLLKEASKQHPDNQFSVLDMCAAPGSKTTQLAALTNNQAVIVALDNSAPRLKALQNNLERVGATTVVVYHKDAKYADDLNQKFEYVSLDAPCSGNFCVEPDFFDKRTVTDFKNRAKEQLSLLKAAVKVLKPNGVLVYSTCSLEPEENELLINEFLENNDALQLLPMDLPVGDAGLTNVFGQEISLELAKTRRFWPHKTGTQGFFIAKLQKR